jgi:DNA-binding transcriptional LysR family regulator
MLQQIDLSRVDLNLLVLFEAVQLERHVGRAAARLQLSPSAISHGLARLRRLLHDPLFLKHPKGVVPTQRAQELSVPLSDILQRVRGVLATADGFDPETSTRRFTIGAPDAIFASLLRPLMTELSKRGPFIDLSIRTILPQSALAALDARDADLVIQPFVDVPPRFHAARLYQEQFAIAMRVGHPLGARLTLPRYCASSHVLVSDTRDPHGNVDVELHKLGRTRRVAATVPNFLLALALVAETDLLAAVPRRLATHAKRFGVLLAEPPPPLAPLTSSSVSAITTRAAMADAGVAWLFKLLEACTEHDERRKAPRRSVSRS